MPRFIAAPCASAALLVLSLYTGCRGTPETPRSGPSKTPNADLGEGKPIPTHTITRASGPLEIDGHLRDAAWQRVKALDLVIRETAEPSPLKTTVKLLWDDEYLYAGFYCEDPNIWTRRLEEDDRLWTDDVVELFIDPTGHGFAYYEYEVNPVNAKTDLIIINDGKRRDAVTRAWKDWDLKGARNAVYVKGDGQKVGTDDEYWTVEIALPLQQFWGAPNLPPKPGDTWRFNACRVDRGEPDTRKDDVYLATSPTYGPYHRPWRFGRVVFAGPGGEE